MRLRSWFVAAVGLGSLLLLIVASMLTTASRAQQIFTRIDQVNEQRQEVETKLRSLRSDVNLSGIFVRDYLLDVARERAPEYRDRLAEFRTSNKATIKALLVLDPAHADSIHRLESQLDDYWQTFEPLFDWTVAEKIFQSARFLRREVVPRRDAILAIAQDIERLNQANLAVQRDEVKSRQAAFAAALRRLLWQTVLLGFVVSLVVVLRLRTLETRSEQQRAIAEEAERQMRHLSQERDAAQEEERRRLSRELHDHVAQVLTALRMELGRIDRTRSADDGRVAASVAEAKKLVDDMFRTIRHLALGLRPTMLDDFGLQAALEWHVRDLSGRSGANIELTIDGDLAALPDRYRTCIYRAVQEALTNSVRHANAKAIKVTVARLGDRLAVSVADDGDGFDATQHRTGLGLRGIEERVKELGGTMAIWSGGGAGTTLAVSLPWPADEEAALARVAG